MDINSEDYKCAIKNLKFCGCWIGYEDRRFLGTRCWEYLRDHKEEEKFIDEYDYPVVEGLTLIVWNLEEKKYEYLLIDKFKYAHVDLYNKRFYLK